MKIGIAASSGTFKGVFIHGVLTQFEEERFFADIYASSSSSLISCSMAATRQSSETGVDYWIETLTNTHNGIGMSSVVLASIEKYSPQIKKKLFNKRSSRLLIATSFVKNSDAALITQGDRYKNLGRRLLISSLKKDSSWVDENLDKTIFDTHSKSTGMILNTDNYDEVAYASTRMLHAWDIPAWIGGKPFIDGSYTCSCPAYELSEECTNVIAIGVEKKQLFTSIFQKREIIDESNDTFNISIIKPDFDLREIGVDYLTAEISGLRRAYDHGRDCAKRFLDNME